jgi:Ca2+-binding EF-hand superfamily protein
MGCGASSTRIVNSQGKRSAAEIIFQKYDKDRSGKLERGEFQKMCMSMGYHLTKEELDLDMKLLDLNGDGKIGYSEFVAWWKTENRFANLQWTADRLKLIDTLGESFQKYN